MPRPSRRSSRRGATTRGGTRDWWVEAPLERARISQPVDVGGERTRGPAPLELVHIPEQGRVGPEGCQLLEAQRQVTAVPQHGRWEGLAGAVLVQEPRCRDPPYPRNAGVSVGPVA